MGIKFDSVLKFLPLIFGTMTVVGYIYLQTFYLFFDINITDYLELSEIPLLFYNGTIIMSLTLLIFLIYFYVKYKRDKELQNSIDNENDSQKKEEKEKEKKILEKKVDKRLKIIKILLVLSLIAILAIAIITKNYIKLLYPISIIIFFLIIQLNTRGIISLINVKNEFTSISMVIIILMFIYFNIYLVCLQIECAYNLKYEKGHIKSVVFEYNNKKIRTNDNLVYLGQTRNNLFLYNREMIETLVFKRENIDNFKIINKEDIE